MRRIVTTVVFASIISVPAWAQIAPTAVASAELAPVPSTQHATPAPAPPAGQPTPTPQAAPAAPSARYVDPRIDQADVNIKLAITVTDTSDGGAKKSLTLLIANQGDGRVRSVNSNQPNQQLNVDASATLLRSGAIRTSLSINYSPGTAAVVVTSAAGEARPADTNQSVTVFLKDGVPTIVSQSADPKGDRKVTVEVTATIVKT